MTRDNMIRVPWCARKNARKEDAKRAMKVGTLSFDHERASEVAEDVDLHPFLKTLTPKEAKIISLRFGLDGNGPRTLQEIGDTTSTTRENVRKHQEKILKKMRKA